MLKSSFSWGAAGAALCPPLPNAQCYQYQTFLMKNLVFSESASPSLPKSRAEQFQVTPVFLGQCWSPSFLPAPAVLTPSTPKTPFSCGNICAHQKRSLRRDWSGGVLPLPRDITSVHHRQKASNRTSYLSPRWKLKLVRTRRLSA